MIQPPLSSQESAMRYLLTTMLALLLSGCEQAEPDPEGVGAWMTLGRSGKAAVFVRYSSGETERWAEPFSTVFGDDGKTLTIVLRTNRCGEMSFHATLGSELMTRVNTTETVARALPCRLNTTEAPPWKLLTTVINSTKQ
jgi:hypothetical protein